MSRLLVKNIPKYITEERFRTHFSVIGEVTDAKIMKTKDGRSRLFGFVGYKNAKDAQKAVKHFNNTFIDTAKVTVEVAKSLGDPSLERPWSKYSKGSSAFIKAQFKLGEKNPFKQNEKPQNQSKESAKTDEKTLKRFLGLLDEKKPVKEKQTYAWSNDDIELVKKELGNVQIGQEHVESKKTGGKGTFLTRTHIKFNDDDDDDDDKEQKEKKTEKKEVEEDDDFIELSEEEKKDSESDEEEDEEKTDAVEKQKETVEQVNIDEWEEGRLFVRNLPYTTKEEELKKLFSKFGTINEINFPIDKKTNKSKGFAHITYMIPQDSLTAFQELDGKHFQGRLLHILPGRAPKKPKSNEAQDEAFKTKKEKELREQASIGFNWNSFLVRSDTAVTIMSDRMNMTKDQIIGRDSENAAAKLAVAEAVVVQETKSYLEKNGVLLSSFDDATTRSQTTIIVKNLPAHTVRAEIENLFKDFGEIIKMVMPPSNVIAIIEFSSSSSAKNAFKNLAYRKYLNLPLFLEWAPKDVFAGSVSEENNSDMPDLDKKEEKEENEESQPDPSATIVAKNLSYETNEESLQSLFSTVATVRNVKIARRNDTKKGELVSLGYAFIELKSVEDATKALKLLNNRIVDNRAISLTFSQRKPKGVEKKALEQLSKRKQILELPPNQKLMIRNLPFEATRKDLKEVFSAFGVVKTIRIPRSALKTRGFAFVEMLTLKDAQTAKEALSDTHLYGRHLVIEYADERGIAKAMKENESIAKQIEEYNKGDEEVEKERENKKRARDESTNTNPKKKRKKTEL